MPYVCIQPGQAAATATLLGSHSVGAQHNTATVLCHAPVPTRLTWRFVEVITVSTQVAVWWSLLQATICDLLEGTHLCLPLQVNYTTAGFNNDLNNITNGKVPSVWAWRDAVSCCHTCPGACACWVAIHAYKCGCGLHYQDQGAVVVLSRFVRHDVRDRVKPQT